jgi:hypothetical protein
MTDDPRIDELSTFTCEGTLTPGYGDSYLFFVGRDDVHGVLKKLISSELLMLKFSMFGYNDDELNDAIMKLMKSKTIKVQGSLDKSQAGGVHERKILALDEKLSPVEFGNSIVIRSSPTGQILHTKGGVCVGQGIGFEGSTNWSDTGEGTDMAHAQSNTLLVTTNPVTIARFSASLDSEHLAVIHGSKKK